MPRSSLANRFVAIRAVVASLAILAGAALPAAPAAATAPLLDGWRPAPAPVVVTVHVLRVAGPGPAATPGRAVSPAGGDPCSDRARSVTGARWADTYEWSFRARTTPGNLTRRAAAAALKQAVANITRANNDCGRPDRVSATARYLGVSDRRPAPTANGTCAPQDEFNAVGFGRLPAGIAGLTCIWSIGDRIIEADIKLDKGAQWATTLATCSFETMVEAVATHEFGHVFGLGHVSEESHGRLTMSERLDGYCQNGESTLGTGDMLGLEALY